jgi:hypothetical protein
VRPESFPRGILVWQERGSIPYSAVTQPVPEPFKNGGTESSTEAVQMTLVLPISIKQEPSAYFI